MSYVVKSPLCHRTHPRQALEAKVAELERLALFDGLGTIVGMTDSSGKEVNGYVYDPYGQVINQQEQSGLNNPWKFAGGYLDSSTSLYKFGTRYYDPSLGRWTQQDPVGGSLGDLNAANRYTYANDDPVNVVDPSGRDATSLGLCIVSYIVGIFSVLGGIAQSASAVVALGAPYITADVVLAIIVGDLGPGILLFVAGLFIITVAALTFCKSG